MVSFPMAVSPGETRSWVLNHCWRGLVCASLLLAAGSSGVAAQTETRFFRIGTASTGGSSACGPGGGCGVPGLVAVAVATQGSMENLRLVNNQQLESGFAQADLASMAYDLS